MAKKKTTTAYKAFDQDFKCRDFQYEVGKSYKHDGDVIACDSGFHACTNPMDCWSYYDITSSRYAVVELSGRQDTKGSDSKIASAEISIKAELSLPQFISRAVDYVIGLTEGGEAASGYNAQLAASGDYAQLAASGNRAQLAASGDNSVVASAGYNASAKGAHGTWIALAEFDENGKCVGFATGKIGSDGLKPETFYKAQNGKLVEVK